MEQGSAGSAAPLRHRLQQSLSCFIQNCINTLQYAIRLFLFLHNTTEYLLPADNHFHINCLNLKMFGHSRRQPIGSRSAVTGRRRGIFGGRRTRRENVIVMPVRVGNNRRSFFSGNRRRAHFLPWKASSSSNRRGRVFGRNHNNRSGGGFFSRRADPNRRAGGLK